MTSLTWILFLCAGALGAIARYLVDRAIRDRTRPGFPWGTFVVNVSGSLLLGWIAGRALYHGLPSAPRLVAGTGFCGAYTTFSTFTFETVRLIEEGAVARAFRNVVGSVGVCAIAAAAGLAVASF